MSFMFHPYPYADPSAVNKIEVPESVRRELTIGILNVAKKISSLFDDGVKSIGIDAYPGAEYETLINVLKQQLATKNVEFVDATDVLLPSEVITAKVKPYLPENIPRGLCFSISASAASVSGESIACSVFFIRFSLAAI